jgi:hypothetical protein
MPGAAMPDDWRRPLHDALTALEVHAERGDSIDSAAMHAALLTASRWVLFVTIRNQSEEVASDISAYLTKPVTSSYYLGMYARLAEIQRDLDSVLHPHRRSSSERSSTRSDLPASADQLKSLTDERQRIFKTLDRLREETRKRQTIASGFAEDQSALRADQQELVDDFRVSVLKVLGEEHPEVLHDIVLRMLQQRQPTVRSPRVLDALVKLGEALQDEASAEEDRARSSRLSSPERGSPPRPLRNRKSKNAPDVEDGDKKRE